MIYLDIIGLSYFFPEYARTPSVHIQEDMK